MRETGKKLSEKIKSFDEVPGVEEVPVADVSTVVDEAAVARLAMVEMRMVKALAELTGTLEEEVQAVHELRYEFLPEAADRKEALLVALDGLIEEASFDAPRSWVAETFGTGLQKLAQAAQNNEKALKLLEETVRQIVGIHVKAEKEMGSEGLYGSSGRQVEPAEFSLAGMKFDL
jgi:hypothetical protein